MSGDLIVILLFLIGGIAFSTIASHLDVSATRKRGTHI